MLIGPQGTEKQLGWVNVVGGGDWYAAKISDRL